MTLPNDITTMAESPEQDECFQLAHNYIENHHSEIKTHGIVNTGLKKGLWKVAVFALFLCKDQNFQQQSLTHQSYNYGLNNDMSQKVSPKLLRPTMQNTINLKNSSDLGRITKASHFIYCNYTQDNPTIHSHCFKFLLSGLENISHLSQKLLQIKENLPKKNLSTP